MKELFNISAYNNFSDIINSENLKNKIPIFATQQYADYLNESKNAKTIWFVSESFNQIDFLIPFATIFKNLFTKGYFLTAVNNLNDALIEKETEFIEGVVHLIKEKKLCDWIQQGPNWAIFNTYPKGAVFTEFGTYKINLKNKTEDELFNAIETKDRSDVKKALKDGIVIKHGAPYLNDAMEIISATAIKAKLSIPSFQELKLLQNNIEVFVAYLSDKPQSAAIFYSANYSWYNMYAGTQTKPSRGANTLMYWIAIKTAKTNLVDYFDFVGARINPEPGSKQERIQRFKEHFGVDLHKGYLWKMPINKLKYTLYHIAIKIYFKLKNKEYRGDIIDQELKRLNK